MKAAKGGCIRLELPTKKGRICEPLHFTIDGNHASAVGLFMPNRAEEKLSDRMARFFGIVMKHAKAAVKRKAKKTAEGQ